MSFRSDLLARLRADAAVQAIGGARLYWGRRPRGSTLPAGTLKVIGRGRIYTHGAADALAHPRVHFDFWGETLVEALALADAVQAVVETPGTQGGTSFVGAFIEMDMDMDPEPQGDGTEVCRTMRDFIIWHRPA